MIVTINTDASWHNETKYGSYAFWMVSNAGKVQHSGALRNKCARPETAEFRCILNAIEVLGRMKWPNVQRVVVNTDCLNVIHVIKNDTRAIKKYGLATWGAKLMTEYNLLLMKHGMNKKEFDFRHVKAHTSTESKREYVNQWCDDKAKEALMKKLNSLNLTANVQSASQ